MVRRIGVVALLLGLWEALPRTGLVSQIILAPPSSIVQAAWKDPGLIVENLSITAGEAIVAVTFTWIIGVVLGVVLGSSFRATRFTGPLLESAYALPWVVLYPLAIVWLGIGSPSKVTFAAVIAIFPVLLTTAAPVSTVEGRAVLLGRALGATRFQMFTKVVVPFALPQILSGLRVGAGLAVIGVIVGEMLLSVGGIGFMITYYRATFESGYVYLGIVLGIGLAALVNLAMERLEHRIAWWSQEVS